MKNLTDCQSCTAGNDHNRTNYAAKKNKRAEAISLSQEKRDNRRSGTSNTKHNHGYEFTQHAGSWIADFNISQQDINVPEPEDVGVFGEDSFDLLKIESEHYTSAANQAHQLNTTTSNHGLGVDLSEYMQSSQKETTPWNPYNRRFAS